MGGGGKPDSPAPVKAQILRKIPIFEAFRGMGAEEQPGFLTAAIEVHHRMIVVDAAFAPFPDAHQLRDQLGADRLQHIVIIAHRRALGVGLFLGDDDGARRV